MGLFSSDSSVVAPTTNTQQGAEGLGGGIVAQGNRNRVAQFDSGTYLAGDIVNSRVTLSLDDHGAVASAFDYATRVAEGERDSVAEVLGVARDAIAAGVGFGRAAFEIAATVSDDYRGITRESLDFANDIFGQARETIADITADARSSLASALSENSNALAHAVVQSSTTNDERLRQLAGQAFLAVVAAALLPIIFRR